MIVDAAAEDDVAGPIGEVAAELCAEGNEVRGEVALHVGQVATVELHETILAW